MPEPIEPIEPGGGSSIIGFGSPNGGDGLNKYQFGKSVEREFYPVRDVGGISVPYALYSTTANIYLFEDAPTRDAAISGTGALANGLAWSVGSVTPYACTYSFDAITDPEPGSDTNSRQFWESLNITLETGEQIQSLVRSFYVERPIGLPEVPGTSVESIKDIFPSITAYLSDEEIGDHVSIAEQQVKLELLTNNVRWANVVNLSILKLAIGYKAVVMSSISQIRAQGDRHDRRVQIFTDMYKSVMAGLKLYQDTNQDGNVDTVTSARPTHFIISK